MNLFVQTANGELDNEWFILIQTAQKMGISIEEIKTFLNENKTKDIRPQKAFVNNT